MAEEIEIEIDLPSNSKESGKKDDPPKLRPVVQGEVVAEKPGLKTSFRKMFTGEHVKTIFEFIGMSVILPSLKSMVFDSITKGTEKALFGEDSSRYNQASRVTGPIQYSMISTQNARGQTNQLRALSPSRDGRDDRRQAEVWVIPSRGEAELVLDSLEMQIKQYGRATVADYYELINKTSLYTDNNWGWVDLRGTRIERAQGGYILTFPNAIPV